ncbi:hypothetical protein UFOVP607_1 [uncultured Caudovirales phage]|uniref:Tail fiber protein n=1 Tax=uncultured Caudovirales phage TaxID=2100421 RepID=A0A6J5N2J3_9CAUD|nr:hypothetical protein UFOVP607_1 [uncultured Caudovirales phage]
MTGVIATIPRYQFSNSLGVPLANGTLTVYLAGTTTPTNTWQDQALTTLNTNPITLDSRGECVLWLNSTVTYKFVLKNSVGVTQWTADNIYGNADAATVGQVADAVASAMTTALAAKADASAMTTALAATVDANFLSKVDTAAQTMAGDVNWAAGKAPYWGLSNSRNEGTKSLFADVPDISGDYWVSQGASGVPDSPKPSYVGTGWHLRRGATWFGYSFDIAIYATTNEVFYRAGPTASAWQSLGGTPTRTYHDVTASRAANVTYTNSRSYEIEVYITYLGYAAEPDVNGLLVYTNQSANDGATVTASSFVVPSMKTYVVPSSTIIKWVELY